MIIDLETSLGPIAVELDAAHAPITVENFLAYVDDGFYDGDDGAGATTFHRVVSGFVIQGGGYTPEGALKNTLDPIALESDNGLSNLRGTIAMARTNVPDSATSQFYFNLVDNTFLDYDGAGSPGYAVFGAIVEGLDTMDDIAAVQTNAQDQPVEDVVITAAGRR
ncbi:MAG: peptidylprolyl isomerase [Alphaproteobacteria bacterium]|nr:peptidylprolyl isomerase [Alphaproteobacteria bacterium]